MGARVQNSKFSSTEDFFLSLESGSEGYFLVGDTLCVSLFYSSHRWWVLPSLRASLSAVSLLCESPALGCLLNELLEILPSPSPTCSTRELAQVRGLRRSPFPSILSSPHTCRCPLHCCQIVSHFATLSFYPISQNNRYGMKSLIYWCCLVGVPM